MTASALPVRPPEPRRSLLTGVGPEVALTAACGLSLALSFLPGWTSFAYLSVACGSVEAVRAAYDSLRQRQLDVNLLMVLAAAGAVGVGRASDAGGLLFLFSLSTTLEAVAMARTRSAIEGLIRLRPSEAWQVLDGTDHRVAVEALHVGDLVRVPAYDSIPTDAVVVEGRTRVDKSAMTGESIAIETGVGDAIIGGTQNLEGTIIGRVTAEVGDSALDRIVSLVQDAQENKASGERISQWFGQRYTVFVLFAFLASLAVRAILRQPFSDSFYASLTLLVGLSPCALVISTPATTLSALAWCARHGILVRGGEFIEKAGQVRAVALDKTGTLTWGRPRLCAIAHIPAGSPSLMTWAEGEPVPSDLDEVIAQAAGVEQFSNHPIAVAILEAARGEGKDVPEVAQHTVVSGLGVTARSCLGRILVGREALLVREGISIPSPLAEVVSRLESEGRTVSLVASPLGVSAFAFSDGLREGAAALVCRLRELGIRRIAILTGDRSETAKSVADRVGIQEVHAELLPGEKTGIIGDMAKHEEVMMVGDGVNDAPSLASASLGVAMGGLGSDIAMNAADVVLVNDRVDRIPDLIRLGRQTTATVRANLTFAGAVIVTLTIASLATQLPLPLAVIGHEGSTVLVILNGLRMLRGPSDAVKG